MLKDRLMFLLIVVFSFGCNQQKAGDTDDISIRKLLDSYRKAYINKDWDNLTNLIHPGVFDFLTKSEFSEALELAMTRENYRILVNDMAIDSFSSVIRDNSDKYALVYLRNRSIMELTKQMDSVDKDVLFTSVCEQLKEKYDKDYVSCKGTGNTIEYVILEKCYVVFLSDKQKWFLLNKTREGQAIIDGIIPERVRKMLPG